MSSAALKVRTRRRDGECAAGGMPSPEAHTLATPRSRPLSYALTLAVTVGVLYLACAVVVALVPGALAAALRLVLHGLNLSLSPAAVEGMTWSRVLLGTLAIGAYAFIAGGVFGFVRDGIERGRR